MPLSWKQSTELAHTDIHIGKNDNPLNTWAGYSKTTDS